jgi:hypothetical protein
MSKNNNGECDGLGHIVMLLFKALALGKKIIIIIFQSYKLQGQIPSCVLVDFSTQKKCCSPQKYDN